MYLVGFFRHIIQYYKIARGYFTPSIRLCQVGNTSSRKIAEVKQLGPYIVSTFMGDHSSVEVDAIVNNSVKSQER